MPIDDVLHLICDARTHDVESQGLFANPINFYDFLQNRVLILFRPKFEEPNEDLYPEFELVLSKKMNYDVVRSTRMPISHIL